MRPLLFSSKAWTVIFDVCQYSGTKELPYAQLKRHQTQKLHLHQQKMTILNSDSKTQIESL